MNWGVFGAAIVLCCAVLYILGSFIFIYHLIFLFFFSFGKTVSLKTSRTHIKKKFEGGDFLPCISPIVIEG